MLQLKSLHDLPERRLAVHTAQPAYISCAAERRDLPAPLYAQVIEISKQEARVKRVSCADGIGDPDLFRLPVVSPAIGRRSFFLSGLHLFRKPNRPFFSPAGRALTAVTS